MRCRRPSSSIGSDPAYALWTQEPTRGRARLAHSAGGTVSDRLPLHSAVLPGRLGDYQGPDRTCNAVFDLRGTFYTDPTTMPCRVSIRLRSEFMWRSDMQLLVERYRLPVHLRGDTHRPTGTWTNPCPPSSQGPGRRVTIRDVALEAGVSVSAVSKVLRNAYGVSPAMRANVTETMERLGYRPHAGARTLRGSSYTIGVMMVSLASHFQPEIAESINEELGSTPYQDILVTAASSEQQQQSIQALVDRQMDGLILISPSMDRLGWSTWALMFRPSSSLATVGATTSTRSSTTTTSGRGFMVDHLVALGHRSIAHTSEVSHGLEGRACSPRRRAAVVTSRRCGSTASRRGDRRRLL